MAVKEATELLYIARGREMDKEEGAGGAGNKVTILQEMESWQGLGNKARNTVLMQLAIH